MPWPVTSSRVAYENRWIRVVEDQVVAPDGSAGLYGVVEVRQPAVFVVALTDADEVLLVNVDRHTVGRSWEVPAGGTDGEDPLVAARRELLEETGFEASSWSLIGRMDALNGVSRAPEVVWLATGLTRPDAAALSVDQRAEGIAAVRAVPWGQTLGLVSDGTISDGETVAALLYAALHLGRVH